MPQEEADESALVKAKGGTVVLDEERVTGAVTLKTYKDYFSAIRSPIMIAGILSLLVLEQVSLVGNSLFLGFWSTNSLDLSMAQYMACYAGELHTRR
jgi:ATP-binding cassette subfamily C (CFTR/MRP) protein 1